MTEFQITLQVERLSYDELSDAGRRLVEAARKATERSYAPYSHFCVGAAIRLEDGTIVEGANQENVAYPSGTCAERSACFWAHAQYPDKRFECIAIAARGTDGEFTAEATAPCGACRQALLQYEMLAGKPVPVLLAARDHVLRIPSVQSLLPLAFTNF